MRAIVLYESMFGCTRAIGEAIAEGMRPSIEVSVVRAADAAPLPEDVDLVIVGAPTHAWSMPRARTRRGAPNYVAKPGSDLVLETGADAAPGVREWLQSVRRTDCRAAAFDTRIRAPAAFTGRASKVIARHLARRGLRVIAAP